MDGSPNPAPANKKGRLSPPTPKTSLDTKFHTLHLRDDELIEDVREIIDVFNARLYGLRSQKNKKLIEEMKNAVQNAQAAR